MSARPVGTAPPLVLRQSSAVLVPVVVWGFCVLAVADAVVEGSPAYAARAVLWLGGVAFAVWMLLFSPRLEVARDGLRVVNPLRVHVVPFAALESVRVRGLTTVTFREAGGRTRTVSSWNAPGVPRRFVTGTPPSEVAIEVRRSAWEQAGGARREDEGEARTTWRRNEAVVLVTLILVAFVIWLL